MSANITKRQRRFTHRVERVSTGANCGEHMSFELATKRVGRLVAMSNGRLTAADFRINETGSEHIVALEDR
jgi:hypothetical protein